MVKNKVLPDIFEQTSNGLYDRHDYKIYFKTKKPEIYDNYQDTMRVWFQTPNQFLDYIEVLDKQRVSPKNKNGFG